MIQKVDSGVLHRTAFVELSACKCWPEVVARLREGASCRAVAEYMYRMGEMLHVKKPTLQRQLARYRDKVLKIRALSPTYIDSAISALNLTIDDVQELTKVILIQKQRVSKDLQLEKKMPKLAPWLLKEVQLLFDMIERRARLLQDMGVLQKAPSKSMIAIMGDETWARLLDTLEPGQREKAREIVQMEYADVRNKAISVEQSLRGTRLIPPALDREEKPDERDQTEQV